MISPICSHKTKHLQSFSEDCNFEQSVWPNAESIQINFQILDFDI